MSAYFRPLEPTRTEDEKPRIFRCPDLVGFFALWLQYPAKQSLHRLSFLINKFPDFDDVVFQGGSFNVRRVQKKSLPPFVLSQLRTSAEFVAVKHPIVGERKSPADLYSDI